MPIGAPGTSVGPGLVDLAGLKTFAKNFKNTEGLSAEDKVKFGTADAKGLTREQVMLKGGLTGIEGLNIDFKTKDGLAIWNSIAGADGLLSAREHTQALLRFDTGKEADVAGSDTKFNLSKAEATAGFQKLLADAKADPKGIAKSYVALNKVGEDTLLDKDDASFNENAAEVTAANNIVGGDFWGSIAPPAASTATGTLAAILDKITDATQKALVKTILEALGVK
jgi:hypothetical protein